MPSSFPPKRNDRAPSSRGHSQAWLAAEALFSVEPEPAPPASTDAPVIVRRPVRHAEGDAALPAGAAGDESPRAPKVHRVEAFSDAATAAAQAVPSAEPVHRRRRRRQLSGEVTIIRPAVEAAPAEPVEIPELAWPRYPKLMAHIDALRAEAAMLRKQERAQAIEWIRMAIEKYRVPDWVIESASVKR